MFIFDFNKYKKSNIHKLKELPMETALKIKLHFLSLEMQSQGEEEDA
jgi:hypothetical protein